jgi:hypothetical protein
MTIYNPLLEKINRESQRETTRIAAVEFIRLVLCLLGMVLMLVIFY